MCRALKCLQQIRSEIMSGKNDGNIFGKKLWSQSYKAVWPKLHQIGVNHDEYQLSFINFDVI